MTIPYPSRNGVKVAQNGVYRTQLELIIDDFEHNDETRWESDGGGIFDIQSTTTYNGDYAALLSGTKRVWTHPNWGAQDHFPQAGDMWEFYILIGNHDDQVRLYFARDDVAGFDSSLGYQIQMYSDGTYRIRDSDGNNLAENYSVTYELDTWYRVRHWWKHPDYTNDHVLELYNTATDTVVETISGDNSTVDRDSGGLQMYSNDPSESYFDEIQITERTA